MRPRRRKHSFSGSQGGPTVPRHCLADRGTTGSVHTPTPQWRAAAALTSLGVPVQQRFLSSTNPRRSVTCAPAGLSSGDPLSTPSCRCHGRVGAAEVPSGPLYRVVHPLRPPAPNAAARNTPLVGARRTCLPLQGAVGPVSDRELIRAATHSFRTGGVGAGGWAEACHDVEVGCSVEGVRPPSPASDRCRRLEARPQGGQRSPAPP
jgi:hypothetical protein